MTPKDRELVEKRTDPASRFVLSVLRRREAGLTRQKTTTGITALYCTQHNAWKCKETHA